MKVTRAEVLSFLDYSVLAESAQKLDLSLGATRRN